MTHPRIASVPGVMGGRPCIKGTRLPVEHILGYLGSGDSVDDVLQSYPYLTREDILAALTYAADYLRQESVIEA